jgi:V/A-type H+/Na+-transporting ATPase subunit I
MRINVKKYFFFGLEKDRDAFFKKAQELGIIEFIDKKISFVPQELPEEIQRVCDAIKVLRVLPPVEQEEFEDDELIMADYSAVCILKLNSALEALKEEKRILHREISRIKIFGDFDLEDLAFIELHAQKKVQYFFKRESDDVIAVNNKEVIYIGSAHGLDYYCSINDTMTSYEGLIEMRIDKPVGMLQKRLEEVEEEISFADKELRTLASYNDLLHKALVNKFNVHNLDSSQAYAESTLDDNVFFVEGWVATCNIKKLDKLLLEMNIYGENIAIEAEDKVPTHLLNEGVTRVGEDLVSIYDTPSIHDKDPSPWVLWGFVVFFAMIIGDGGYGLIFLAFSLFLKFKLKNATGLGKRMVTLFIMLSIACTTWGVLTNSFFGMQIGSESIIRKASVLNYVVEKKAEYHIGKADKTYLSWIKKYPFLAEESNAHAFLSKAVTMPKGKMKYTLLEDIGKDIMLELALAIGVIHITLSMLRGIRKNWAGAGWILFMAGGYLYFPSMLKATSFLQYLFALDPIECSQAGLEFLGCGGALAVILSLIQNKASGSMEITNTITVFADVLSYLRLYALSLAGTMMSSTFNDIAGSVSITAGVVILFIGHSVNIILSIIGGVIHGLRLYFIEWYHYSFEGGGKPHKPLKTIKIK